VATQDLVDVRLPESRIRETREMVIERGEGRRRKHREIVADLRAVRTGFCRSEGRTARLSEATRARHEVKAAEVAAQPTRSWWCGTARRLSTGYWVRTRRRLE
jgi:hypothetical protein